MSSIRDILASTGADSTEDFIRGYTSDGHAFLRGMIERNDGWPEKADYAAMSFVRDWDSLQNVYP